MNDPEPNKDDLGDLEPECPNCGAEYCWNDTENIVLPRECPQCGKSICDGCARGGWCVECADVKRYK